MTTIILDRTLSDNTKKLDYVADLVVQPTLNIANGNMYFSEYEHSQHLVKPMTHNNFINSIITAYNAHISWRVRPDDLHMVLQMAFATCFNNNAQQLRHFFIAHEGKMKLKIESSRFYLNYFCETFKQMMADNVKDPEFIRAFTQRYTTTTALLGTVSNMFLMNALKEYFSFEMHLSCGIPSIIMEGTLEDWHKLKAFYEYFKNLLEETELKEWFKHFDIIMDMFIKMRNLKAINNASEDDLDYEATPDIKELCKRVISFVPVGSGGDTILGGWARLFVPYSDKNKIIGGLNKPIKCLDINWEIPPGGALCSYTQQDILKEYYMASGWNSMQTSYLTTPAMLIVPEGDGDKTYYVELYAGFFNPVIYTSIGGYLSVGTNIGFIMREDTALQKQKLVEDYMKQGVYKERGFIRCPIALKDKFWEISAAFDVCGGNYYVPDKANRKKYYEEQGVTKIKCEKKNKAGTFTLYGYDTVRVPEHFKPNTREILMCFDINHVITDEHIVFYQQQPLEKVAPNTEPSSQPGTGQNAQLGTGQNTIIYFDI